jgi:hypothetical protein
MGSKENITLTKENTTDVAEKIGRIVLTDRFRTSTALGKILDLKTSNGPDYLLHVSTEGGLALCFEHIPTEGELKPLIVHWGSGIRIDEEHQKIQIYTKDEAENDITVVYEVAK